MTSAIGLSSDMPVEFFHDLKALLIDVDHDDNDATPTFSVLFEVNGAGRVPVPWASTGSGAFPSSLPLLWRKHCLSSCFHCLHLLQEKHDVFFWCVSFGWIHDHPLVPPAGYVMVIYTVAGKAIVDGQHLHFDAEMTANMEGQGLQLASPSDVASPGGRRVLLSIDHVNEASASYGVWDHNSTTHHRLLSESSEPRSEATHRRQLGSRRRRSRGGRRRSGGRSARRPPPPPPARATVRRTPPPPPRRNRRRAPPPPPAPRNCRGQWMGWGACNAECRTPGRARPTQSRRYVVQRSKRGNGRQCPANNRQIAHRNCNNHACPPPTPPVHCAYRWGPFSACDEDCDGKKTHKTP